jgi:hypothetical protein
MIILRNTFYRNNGDGRIYQVVGTGKNLSRDNEVTVCFRQVLNANNANEIAEGNVNLSRSYYCRDKATFVNMYTQVDFITGQGVEGNFYRNNGDGRIYQHLGVAKNRSHGDEEVVTFRQVLNPEEVRSADDVNLSDRFYIRDVATFSEKYTATTIGNTSGSWEAVRNDSNVDEDDDEEEDCNCAYCVGGEDEDYSEDYDEDDDEDYY